MYNMINKKNELDNKISNYINKILREKVIRFSIIMLE